MILHLIVDSEPLLGQYMTKEETIHDKVQYRSGSNIRKCAKEFDEERARYFRKY